MASRAKLRDLCRQDRQVVPAGSKGSDQLPYLGLEHVESGSGEIAAGLVADGAEVKSTTFAFDHRHVLYGKLRPYLNKVAIPEFAGRCSTEFIPLLPAKGVSREFLAALLRRPETVRAVMQANTGSRMPRTDMGVLLDLEVPLPPLGEQRRIVDILNRANSIRRLKRAALDKAHQLLPALFVDAFGDAGTNPKRWPVITLDTLITDGPQNGLYKPASAYGSGVPILRIDSFYDGQITDLKTLRRVQLDETTISRYSLRENDVIINRVNSRPFLGKSAIVPAMHEPTVFESNMMRFTVDSNNVDPRYLIAVLQTRHVREQLLARAKDAINQSSINQTDVCSIRLPIPPLAYQQLFADHTAVIRATIAQQRLSLGALEHLYQALLGRLFLP